MSTCAISPTPVGACRVPDVGRLLRAKRAVRSKPFLMYGLTEAFRSTFLPPAEVDRRPDSIGKAIPNAEILVLREDGSECAPEEPGELVHRGALVAWGYWNDAEKTPSATSRCRPAWVAARLACNCPRSPCSPATRCAAMPRAFCTSWAAATR